MAMMKVGQMRVGVGHGLMAVPVGVAGGSRFDVVVMVAVGVGVLVLVFEAVVGVAVFVG